MKFLVRSLLAVAVSSTLGACASGGGGGGETQTAIDGIFCAALGQDAGCAARARANQGAGGAPVQADRPHVTNWNDHTHQTVQTRGMQVGVSYAFDRDTGLLRPTSEPESSDGVRVDLYHSSTQVQYFESGRVNLNYGKPIAGHSGIEALNDYGWMVYGPSEFSDRAPSGIGIFAHPYKLDWEFQSFGVWNNSSDATITASSYGPASPATAVPTSGSAEFTGKLAGMHISPAGQGSMAAADLSVAVDFGRRSLDLASSGTTITRDREVAIAAPHLNVSGSLSYAPGSASFSGTLANAGGTMSGASNGKFYGPTAQELGGVFALKSATTVETFVGAYGAKR